MNIRITVLLLLVQIFFCQFTLAQDTHSFGNITAERKIALMIGNTNYDASVGRLKNPANDAKNMADALQRLGFTLVGGKAQLDLNKKQMLDLIREFGKQIKQGGIGFFYFSGHGVQVNKENYIIPIADSLVYEDDAATEAVNVDMVAKEMQYAENRLNILVLDACRNNNLQKRDKNTEGGLTEPKRKPRGTFIAFAADDGQMASDNVEGKNGLFTQELLKNLEAPNTRLDDVFRVTRNAVERLSSGRQQPMFFDRTNEAILLNSKENAAVQSSTSDSPYYIYSTEFRRLAKKFLKYFSVNEYSEGLVAVRTVSKDNGFSYGFVDKSGEEIIPLIYNSASDFSDELAMVGVYKKGKGFLHGFIDKNGREVIPLKFEDARNFSDGLAQVAVTDFKEKGAGEFSPPLKFGFIDKTGKFAISPKYYDASSFSEGLAAVFDGRKWGFINKAGKIVIPNKYDVAYSFSNGLAIVGITGLCNFIDKKGAVKKTFKQYDGMCYDISEEMIEISSNNKTGYINSKGDIVIPPRYDTGFTFSQGFAEIWTGSRVGFIDKSGNEVIPVKYETSWCNAFKNQGIFGVELNGKKGFVDLYGNEYFDF